MRAVSLAHVRVHIIRGHEVVYLPFCCVLRDAVPLLNLADQLIPFSGNHVEIVIRQLAPVLFDLANRLFPLAFDAVPVHGILLFGSSALVAPYCGVQALTSAEHSYSVVWHTLLPAEPCDSPCTGPHS